MWTGLVRSGIRIRVTNSVKSPKIATNTRALSVQRKREKSPEENVNGASQAFSVLRKNKKITIPAGGAVIAGIIVSVVLMLTPTSTPEAITYTDLSRNFRACLLSTTRDSAEVNRLWPAI